MPDLNKLMIPAMLALLVVFCVWELRRGWRHGEMRQITRSQNRSPNSGPLRRDSEPFAFWALFAFYVFVVIAGCLMIGVAIAKSRDE